MTLDRGAINLTILEYDWHRNVLAITFQLELTPFTCMIRAKAKFIWIYSRI